ncbi:MAG TPA: hypothetical protein VMG12_27495, partial [Polyangiaceae bacterium]|nr:hypothetical protein [Polyangiaceae bacterium]
MTELDLLRLGRHVAEQEDAALAGSLAADEADAAGERTRRFLAEYAARCEGAEGSVRSRAARGAGPRSIERGRRALELWRWVGVAALAAGVVFALKEVAFAPAPLSFTIGATAEPGVLR